MKTNGHEPATSAGAISAAASPAASTAGTSTAPVVLTEKAAQAVAARARLESKEGQVLRISVQGGGCSGVTYHMDFEATASREGDAVSTQHGITFVIDPKSLQFLAGSTLDYKVELMSQRFVWSNPNAKSSCGCGESFGV